MDDIIHVSVTQDDIDQAIAEGVPLTLATGTFCPMARAWQRAVNDPRASFGYTSGVVGDEEYESLSPSATSAFAHNFDNRNLDALKPFEFDVKLITPIKLDERTSSRIRVFSAGRGMNPFETDLLF